MPLDTSIPLQIGQTQQIQAISPINAMDMMAQMQQRQENARYNAMRELALQQDMQKNALAMRFMVDEKNRAAAGAAQAAADRARYRDILQNSVSPAVSGQRGVGYSGTGVSTNPYDTMIPQLVKSGFVPEAANIAELQNKQLTGRQTEGKIKEQDIKNTTDQLTQLNAGIERASSLSEVDALFDGSANAIRMTGKTPEMSKATFRDLVARVGFDAAKMQVAQGVMAVQKHLSDMLTAQSGRTDVITGADGNTYLLDKATGTVSPATMMPSAGAPSAGAPTAETPASFRAAPTTDAQIKRAAMMEALPAAIQTAEMTLKQVEEMIGSENLFGDKVDKFRTPSQKIPEHPGFQSAVGAGFPFLGSFSGTETTNFNKRLAQVQGKAFLDAYETLKGTGQITEKEGEKATAAKSRMDTAQSEKEFILAAREFAEIIESAVTRAKTKLGGVAPSATAAPSTTAPASSTGGPTVSNW